MKEGKKTIIVPDKKLKSKEFLFVNKSPGKQTYLKKKTINPVASPNKTTLKNQ